MNETDNEERQEPQREDEGLRHKLEGLMPEAIKRMFYAGLGAVFTTEEGIRRLANEFSLPKEVATFLIQQAQSTKDELFRILAGELRGFLESLNLNEELQRLLTSLTFEIRTSVRFVPNDAKLVKPQVKSKMSVRRVSKERPEPAEPEKLEEEEPPDWETGSEQQEPEPPEPEKQEEEP